MSYGQRASDVLISWAFILIAIALIASAFLYLSKLRDHRARRRAHGPAALARLHARQHAAAIAQARASGTLGTWPCGCTWHGPRGNVEATPCTAHAGQAWVVASLINLLEGAHLEVTR